MKNPLFHGKSNFRIVATGIALAGIVGLAAWKVGVPVVHEFQASFAMREFKQMGVAGTYRHHFTRFFGLVDDLARIDQENEELSQKVATLEKKSAVTDSQNTERELASLNEMVEERLKDDAGSELATAIRTIQFEIPNNLSYNQLHVLGIAYFQKGDFEKSALIFNHLLNLKDEGKFRVPENFILSGISWFHLKNYHLANREFKEAEANSHVSDNAHRKALIWQAMVKKGLGNPALTQFALLKFLELYPHSDEAMMVNEGRMPARVRSNPVSEQGADHTKASMHSVINHDQGSEKAVEHSTEAHHE